MIETLKNVVGVNVYIIVGFIVLYSFVRFVYMKKMKRTVYVRYELGLFLFYFYFLVLLLFITPVSFTKFTHKGINLVPFREITRYPFMSDGFVFNVIGNILIYIPFGFFVSHIFEKRHQKHPVRFMILLAIVFECSQLLPFVQRTFDVDDIILNILGALLGYELDRLYQYIKGKYFKQEDEL